MSTHPAPYKSCGAQQHCCEVPSLDRVMAMINDIHPVPARASADSSLSHDIGLDSLDLAELNLAVGQHLDMKVPTAESAKWNTVGDVARYIDEHQNAD